MYVVANKPDAPAANVYEETNKPNSALPMSKSAMNCGPNGIMIMKSMMWVNCTPAKVHNSKRSRRRVSSLASMRLFLVGH